VTQNSNTVCYDISHFVESVFVENGVVTIEGNKTKKEAFLWTSSEVSSVLVVFIGVLYMECLGC